MPLKTTTPFFVLIFIALSLHVTQASAHTGRSKIELPDTSANIAEKHYRKSGYLRIKNMGNKAEKSLCRPIKTASANIKNTTIAYSVYKNNYGKLAANRLSNTKNNLKITDFLPKVKVGSCSRFGKRKDPISNRKAFHKGIDISRPIGTEVFAWSKGVVAQAQWLGAYGLTVDVLHPDGIKTRYAHLQQTNVREGQQLNKGQSIGQVGTTGRTTGANLHFEVMVAGKLANPEKYISENMAIVGEAKE